VITELAGKKYISITNPFPTGVYTIVDVAEIAALVSSGKAF